MSIDQIGSVGTDPATTPGAGATGASSSSSSSSSSATQTLENDGLGENAFLKLLVTQMQNQDPLSPQDNSAFIAQLAQFSSLEQLQGIKGDTDTLVGSLGTLTGAGSGAGSSTSTSSSSSSSPSSSSTTGL